MRCTVRFFCVTLAGFSLVPAPVKADEAYICEGGKLVFVKPEELERKKLTDPCIAGYYGLLPMPPTVAARKDVSVKTVASPVLVPIPSVNKTVQAKNQAPPRPVQAAAKPADGADYRNVRVLNARSGDGAIFQHAR